MINKFWYWFLSLFSGRKEKQLVAPSQKPAFTQKMEQTFLSAAQQYDEEEAAKKREHARQIEEATNSMMLDEHIQKAMAYLVSQQHHYTNIQIKPEDCGLQSDKDITWDAFKINLTTALNLLHISVSDNGYPNKIWIYPKDVRRAIEKLRSQANDLAQPKTITQGAYR